MLVRECVSERERVRMSERLSEESVLSSTYLNGFRSWGKMILKQTRSHFPTSFAASCEAEQDVPIPGIEMLSFFSHLLAASLCFCLR